MWIDRDPNTENEGGQTPAAPVEVPKTKEGWEKLAKDDPTKFTELTQQRMDTIFRQNKELQEKQAAMEENNRNLNLEIQKLKQPLIPLVEEERYGRGRYPKTKEEWNDLFLEDPLLANDLRASYINEQTAVQTDFQATRKNARKVLFEEHPEMYIAELDETGKVKVDEQGKLVLKRDPVSGEPFFNETSEKGKLWTEIYQEDPQGWNSFKNSPSLLMAEMERRLRAKGAAMVKNQGSVAEDDQSGLAPPGVAAPKSKSAKLTEEEQSYAERGIKRGVYKSVEDYVKNRDEGDGGYIQEGRRPDFSKK